MRLEEGKKEGKEEGGKKEKRTLKQERKMTNVYYTKYKLIFA